MLRLQNTCLGTSGPVQRGVCVCVCLSVLGWWECIEGCRSRDPVGVKPRSS